MNGIKPKCKYLRWALISVALILIAVVLEFSVSNYRTLFIDTDSYQTDLGGLADTDNGALTISKGKSTSYTIKNVPNKIYALRIGSASPQNRPFFEPVEITVSAYDVKKSRTLTTVQRFYIAPDSSEPSAKTVWMDFEPTPNSEITLTFEEPYGDVAITELTINPSEGLISFNFVRFAVFALILLLFAAIKLFRLGNIIFNYKNSHHKVTILATIILSLIVVNCFVINVGGSFDSVPYPLENKVSAYNPYVQQTDAFIKGQLNIDYPVSEKLLSLENPYDYDARKGVSYLYDRAMYDGNYYSYFGIAPILNFYLPSYALTGALPGEGTVTIFYAVTATLFASLFIIAYVILYKRRIPLLMLIGALLALPWISNILLISRGYNRFYYTAIIAGMAYLAAFLFFMITAVNAKGKIMRPCLFALAGLSYAMLFLARLNMALLAAFIVIPVVIFCVILRRPALDVADVPESAKEPTSFKKRALPVITDLACLGFFVVVALVFTFWYNDARFGSPFEFGTRYQLTISDVSKNKLSLGALPEAIYHYFLQPLGISSQFPHFSFLYSKLGTYGSYVYVDANFGLFAIPLMFALLLTVPLIRSKKKTAFAKALAISLLLGCLVVSWMNFCLGGVIFRYTSDMTLLCALGALVLLFSFNDRVYEHSDGVISVSRTATYALILVSVYVCLCLCLQINGNLADYPADFFVRIREFFGN